MKKSNRILALLLCLLMCVSLFPAAAFAEDVNDSAAEETEAAEAATDITEELPAEEPAEEIPADEPAEANTVSFEEITVESEPEAAEETVSNDAAQTTVASGTCGDNLTWTLDDAGTLTISGTGDMTNYSYSDYYNGAVWYDRHNSITEIVIGSGVTSLGDFAFCGCSNLTSVAIPGNVTSIGQFAFSGSGLTSVTISEGVTGLSKYAFEGCSSLTSLTIPASVTSIGESVFQNCDSLTAIQVAAGNQNYSSLDGVLFNKTQTILVAYPARKTDTSYSIPSNVTRISSSAFDRCVNLKSVTFEGSAPTFGYGVFANDTLTARYPVDDESWTEDVMQQYGGTVTWVPIGSTQKIDYIVLDIPTLTDGSAFPTATDVTVADGGCAVESIIWYHMTDSGTELASGAAVAGEQYTAVIGLRAQDGYEYPDGEVEVEVSVSLNGTWDYFAKDPDDEGLLNAYFRVTAAEKEAEIIDSGTCGGNLSWTLDDASTLTISGTGGMTNYSHSNQAPWYDSRDSFTKVVIGSGVTSIGDYAFDECSNLTGVTIPDSVTSIGIAAFYICSSLTSVTIPDSVTSIGNFTFFNCENLTSVTILGNVTSIGDHAFYGCTNLTSVTIPDSLTSIGDFAFYICSSLTNVTIPAGVTNIGVRAFFGCSSLTGINVDSANSDYSSLDGVLFNKDQTEIISYPGGKTGAYIIPSSVTKIRDWVFASCGSLTSVTIPDSVTSIGGHAFMNCCSLTSLTIPSSVTDIEYMAITSCDNLQTIEVDAENAHYSSLDGVLFSKDKSTLIRYPAGKSGAYAVPSDVTSIGDNSFFGCSNLTSVMIPDSVTVIDDNAFCGCDNMKRVIFEGSAPEFGTEVFIGLNFTAYYPDGDSTWDHGKTSSRYGQITWVAYTHGDVNGDGVVTVSDLTSLKAVLANDTVSDLANPAAADMNGDRSVNLKDLLLLKRQLAS